MRLSYLETSQLQPELLVTLTDVPRTLLALSDPYKPLTLR